MVVFTLIKRVVSRGKPAKKLEQPGYVKSVGGRVCGLVQRVCGRERYTVAPPQVTTAQTLAPNLQDGSLHYFGFIFAQW